MNASITHKVILLGEPSVGKTSIFVRLTMNKFTASPTATIQMDIGRKVFCVKAETQKSKFDFNSTDSLPGNQNTT